MILSINFIILAIGSFNLIYSIWNDHSCTIIYACFQIACICMLFLVLALTCEGGHIKKRPAGCYYSRRQCEAKVSTVANKYKLAARCSKSDTRRKTHHFSICINHISPTFSVTLFRLTVSAISFHDFCIYLLVVSINIVNIWKPCKKNPLQLLVFKNPYLKGVLVTCIFKNWLFADWTLADICEIWHIP